MAKQSDKDDRLTIERRGGFGGFGLPGSRIKSGGEMSMAKLSPADRKALEAMFESAAALGGGKGKPAGSSGGAKAPASGKAAAGGAIPNPDGFIYRLTRRIGGTPTTVEVTEDRVPEAVRNAVKDSLA